MALAQAVSGESASGLLFNAVGPRWPSVPPIAYGAPFYPRSSRTGPPPQGAKIVASMNWVSFAIGVVMVGLGFLCFFSSKLQQWGMKFTSQGLVWGKIVGAKRAPYVVKYVSSVGFFAYAGFIFYDAFFGH